MFVTTAGRTNEEMVVWAREIAAQLNVEYVPRKKRSVSSIQEIRREDCLVVGKQRLELYHLEEKEPFFFHPNSAMFRIKRLMKGDSDPLIEAARMETGMSFLDCTLGLGSDSIVASFVAGERGKVTGVEARNELAYMVKEGLKTWDSGLEAINRAMREIEVVQGHALDYLKTQEDNSYDCVYFDPMFDETIYESDGIRGLSHFAVHENISKEIIAEAYRVAKKRVILKDHYRSQRFVDFCFKVHPRKSAKFHFGIIEKVET